MPDLPTKLVDVLRWQPEYHIRKNAIITNYRKTTEHYLIVGKLLCDAERGADWKHDGSCARNFHQWVEFELGIKRTQAQRMMGIWVAFKSVIEEHMEDILEIDFSKLALIAPYVNDDNKLDLMHMAKANTLRDLDGNLKEMNGDVSQDTCGHTGAFEVYHKCVQCGKFSRQGGR